jgi:hypothetical protein
MVAVSTDPTNYVDGWASVRDASGADGSDRTVAPALFATVVHSDPEHGTERAGRVLRRDGLPAATISTIQLLIVGMQTAIVERLAAYVVAGAPSGAGRRLPQARRPARTARRVSAGTSTRTMQRPIGEGACLTSPTRRQL